MDTEAGSAAATLFRRIETPNDQENDFLPVEIDNKYGRLRGRVFRPVRNGERRENYYVKFELGGRQVLQGLGTSKPAGALEIAKKKMRAALEGRWDALDKTKLRQDKPIARFGEIFGAYRKHIRDFNPEIEDLTIRTVITCMRSVLRESYPGEAEGLSAEVANEELVERFFAARVRTAGNDPLARDRRIRGANSTLRIARALFSAHAMKCYRKLTLPDLTPFMKAKTAANPKLRNPDLPDEIVYEMAQAALHLRNCHPELYLAHLCFRHLGMRNDEIENARMEWIERRKDEVFLPATGERREIAGYMAVVKRSYWEPKRSEGYVPIAPDVLAEIEALTKDRAPGDYLIQATSLTMRERIVDFQHADFVRPWLEKYPKKSYELRRWGATKVELRQGREFRDRFLRHTDNSTGGRHYSTRQAPPAPITLEDCGLTLEDCR